MQCNVKASKPEEVFPAEVGHRVTLRADNDVVHLLDVVAAVNEWTPFPKVKGEQFNNLKACDWSVVTVWKVIRVNQPKTKREKEPIPIINNTRVQSSINQTIQEEQKIFSPL